MKTSSRHRGTRAWFVERLESRDVLATYVVADLGTAGDLDPRDGQCRSASPSRGCTLTAAIEQLNADGGGTLIFGIGGTFDPHADFQFPTTVDGANQTVTFAGTGFQFLSGGELKNLTAVTLGTVSTGPMNVQNVTLHNSILRINGKATVQQVTGTRSQLSIVGNDSKVQDIQLLREAEAQSELLVQGDRALVDRIQVEGRLGLSGDHVVADSIVVTAATLAFGGSNGVLRDATVERGQIHVEGQRQTVENSIVTEGGVDLTGDDHSVINLRTTGPEGIRINRGNRVAVTGCDTTRIAFIEPTSESRLASNVVSGIQTGGIGIPSGSTVSRGNVIQANLIGTNPQGTAVREQGASGMSLAGDSYQILDNVISSGTFGGGLSIEGNDSVIRGNRVGTDVTGTQIIGNAGTGITLLGARHRLEGNVISGNDSTGVLVIGDDNVVQDNRIGTNLAGTQSIGNGGDGVRVNGSLSAHRNLIKNNVISGNGRLQSSGTGITIVGIGASNNRVEGNFIGTDLAGSVALPNAAYGVRIDGASDNWIGSATGLDVNVISGNGGGIYIEKLTSLENHLVGNYIGTNATGSAAIPNAAHGIFINGALQTKIGGRSQGNSNVISGNLGTGITILNGDETTIEANLIGVARDGLSRLGNGREGIHITGNNNVVGGSESIAANIIAYSGQAMTPRQQGHGVVVAGRSSSGNTIRMNKISHNLGRGIDLAESQPIDSFLANDMAVVNKQDIEEIAPDSDEGANELQNHPVIIGVDPKKGEIRWQLNSSPSATFIIDFYRDPENDLKEYAEGAQWLGAMSVTTNALGYATFVSHVGVDRIVATATDTKTNSTSEFSLADWDGDALADAWEAAGLDVDENGTIDLVLPEADPRHKNLYIEVDAMRGALPDQDRVPPQEVFDLVREAFADAPADLVRNPDGTKGIHLFTTPVESIPFDEDLNPSWAEFDRNKQLYFGNPSGNVQALLARYLSYRYCIFGNRFDNLRYSGLSEIGRRVAFQNAPELLAGGNDFLITEQQTGIPVSVERLAGSFMHELGHTLGLPHGGVDHLNAKPNYRSVMNYVWQIPDSYVYWLPPGSSYASEWKLDYSREVLPTLNEGFLVELQGIGGDATKQTLAGPAMKSASPFRLVPEGGPVDWDRDNLIRGIATKEINNDGMLSVLVGAEDWSRLMFAFQDSFTFRTGAHGSAEVNDSYLYRSENAPVAVRFAEHASKVHENEREAQISVVLTQPSAATVRVPYHVVSGTATNGVDYSLSNLEVVFSPGETVRTITVPIMNDGLIETNEWLLLELLTPENAVLASDVDHLLEIEDPMQLVGDANGDGMFDSADLIAVFQAGEYEDAIADNSTFAEGDWNGDGEFDSSDLVMAFQAGTYQSGG